MEPSTNVNSSGQASFPGGQHPRRRRLMIVCVALLVVIIIALGVWALFGKPAKQKQSNNVTGTAQTAVVEITSSGFVPSTLAVSTNTKVVWVNEDVMPHLPAADPYPTHSSFPELVAPRALGQKETYSFLFTKQHTIHYHDDLNPDLTGTIEVR